MNTRAILVAWNLRALALFLLGPALSVALGGVIFGMTVDLRWATGAAFALILTIFGVLARGEWRRLARSDASSR